MTLEEAKSLGLKKYSSGEPCLHGHVSERYVSGRSCVACVAARAAEAAKSNPAAARAKHNRWKAANPEAFAESVARSQKKLAAITRVRRLEQYAADPTKVLEASRRWRAANAEKAQASGAKWRRNNPDKLVEAGRRAAVDRKANPTKYAASDRRAYLANPARAKEISRLSRERDPERVRRVHLQWNLDNPGKKAAITAAWQRNNPGKVRFYAANRRAKKLLATPAWLTADQLNDIELIYASAKPGEHVDHLVPLVSKIVCGLHVAWNLAAVPALANGRKSNKLEGEGLKLAPQAL